MKTEKNIRKIEELDNPLFDLMQYKVNLEFISESKNQKLYDKYKKIILTEFRSIEVQLKNITKKIYLKYKLSSKGESLIDKYSLNLNEEPNINLKFLILNDSEDKQKYITSYLNSLAQSKNQNLMLYSRLFIINDKFYETFVYNIKNKIPTAKNEVGIIYTPMKEKSFNYIYKCTLIQIIQVFNDFGKKYYDKIKLKEIKTFKKEDIFKQIEEGILYQDFKYVINLCNYTENTMNWIPEMNKIREIVGICLFYEDYYSNEDIIFSEEIKKFFEEVKDKYKKKKDIIRECLCLFKLCVYYLYFPGIENKCERNIQKLLSIANNNNIEYEFQILLHLKIMWLYKQIKFCRKINLNNYLVISLCQKNFSDDNKIKNYMNIFLKLLTDKNNFPIYDIYHKKINNSEIFRQIHKSFEKNGKIF